jgi:hypothetical protein
MARDKNQAMAEDSKQDLVAENKRLAEEAKKAVLEAIIANAPNAGYGAVEHMARAYALVVGAKWGHLPGESPSAGS